MSHAQSNALPPNLQRIVGPLPEANAKPIGRLYETLEPAVEGFVERDGVRTWYAVYGERGPWLVFSPVVQVGYTYAHKMVVPHFASRYRVVLIDLRGNGRSDRPTDPAAYAFDEYYADTVAVIDALGIDRLAILGISGTSRVAIAFAARQPERTTHLILAGANVTAPALDPGRQDAMRRTSQVMRTNFPAFVDAFWTSIFTEPYSTKAYEDAALQSWRTTGAVLDDAMRAWQSKDALVEAPGVRCPTLLIHGANDQRAPIENSHRLAEAIPHARMITVEGGGHLQHARDPVWFANTVDDFLGVRPPRSTWVRALSRKRRALFVSSAIGLGHVQRDLAIARELRKREPDLEIDWFTVDPAASYLEREGERLHPAAKRLANESRHFEAESGEHDLSAFFALRSMDELMAHNFMVFSDLMTTESFDLVIGDEAWDIDYYYHENPELKRQPFVFLTDFVGCLPMVEGDEREAYLCADRNAEEIAHVERFPWIRDRAVFIGNPEDLPARPFGPGLPDIRDWSRRNFAFTGYALPFDPQTLADTERLRHAHGYRTDERVVIASVGGTAVGGALLAKIAAAFPRMKRAEPSLRMILVAGPRLARERFPQQAGLEVRAYVHNLFEHLACADLALVQGGLSTCMELVATRRPFLAFPLERHFEQGIYVPTRLRNYGAPDPVRYRDLSPEALADRALEAMHRPVHYRPVESNGAARAAEMIHGALTNRHWATR